MMNDTGAGILLVDAHVHIYDCFDIDMLLDAALHNFSGAAKKRGLNNEFTGVLLLSETRRDNWFQNAAQSSSQGRWQIEQMPDKIVLRAKLLADDTENIIYIMAGRQIITAEGMELLALATDSDFEDGLSVASALHAVREQNAIPVLPWAVGKWLGKRGKILSQLLKAEAQSDLCLGDNGGRPVFWYKPSHFQQAKIVNIPLLPGTDMLPFSSEVARAGSFGFMMQGKLSDMQPSADLKQLLRNKALQITAYGRLETPLRFVINQLRLRVS